MHFGRPPHAEKVADRWGDVDAGSIVVLVFWSFATENVLPVVGGEGTAIFPLCVAYPPTMNNLDPAPLAGGFSRTFISPFVPPGNDPVGDRVVGPVVEAIVEWQGDVEGVEAGSEGFGPVADTGGLVRVVIATVVLLPLGVP